MELLTTSILTLLALYIIYSEPFKLPTIVKKNKKLVYILIIGLYLYYLQNNNVEGGPNYLRDPPWWVILLISVGMIATAFYIAVYSDIPATIAWSFDDLFHPDRYEYPRSTHKPAQANPFIERPSLRNSFSLPQKGGRNARRR